MSARQVISLTDVPVTVDARLRAAIPEADFQQLPIAAGRERLQAPAPTASVVWLNGDPEPAFRLVRALDAGGARVIVVGAQKDADLILRAMRDGAKEFVLASDEAALGSALRQLVRTTPAQAGGSVHVVFAAKGGVGATTVATNLAGAFQAGGVHTCLVDLNLAMGDVLAFLDLAGGYSLVDLVENMHRLDHALLESTLLRHSSGIHVVAQSHRVEEAERVSPDAVGGLLHFLRRQFGAVVVDGLRNFDELALAAIDASDRIVLLVTPEVPAVRDARRCVELFRRLGCEQKLLLVVNRFEKNLQIGAEVVADTVGLPVAATIANDYAAVIRAVNRGVLLTGDAPRAAATRDVQALAARLSERAGAAAPEKRSILTRLFRGRTSDATE